jgi:putative tricarboxylic transport membrane protein
VDFVTVLIGLFAIGEVLDQLVSAAPEPAPAAAKRTALPRLPLLDLWPLRWSLARGTAVGIAVGGLAGAGATVSSFVSYGLEKQASRHPELFGTGHAGGLVASESSVNGSTGGAMIHLLTLGIPGSAATAVMMGAFLIHGIQPGPLLFTKQAAEVYTIIAGMILANIVMIALGFLAALCFATLMKVPAPILNTFIVVFCFLGAYALRNDMADVWLTMLFGILGFFMRRYDLPIPPLVMGVILGPMAEQYFLTSMVANANDLTVFVTRPVSALILLLSALMVLWPIAKAWRGHARASASPGPV